MVSLLALPKDQVCSIKCKKFQFNLFLFNANWLAGEQCQLNSKWTMPTEQQVNKKHMAVAALM